MADKTIARSVKRIVWLLACGITLTTTLSDSGGALSQKITRTRGNE
jgi:hypothetical protein